MSTQTALVPLVTIRERILSTSPWAVAVWAMAALYAVLLSAGSIYKHYTFQTGFDVGLYDQRLWLLATGHDPFSTIASKAFLGDHFEPGLVLLTPLYWLGLGVPGILVAQAMGLALAAPALYALARASGAPPRVASMPALLWLLCPAVATVALFEFRPATFASALLVLSVLAVNEHRYWLLALTALLALSLKEDIAAAYVVLGLLVMLHRNRRVGAVLTASAAACLVMASVIIQSLGDQFEWQGRRFAGDRGDSVIDSLGFLARHPLDVGDALVTAGTHLLVLLLSTGGLALLAPSWMLLAAPTLMFNAFSAYPPQHSLAYQYHLLVVTGLFIAAAIGSGRLPSLGVVGRRLATLGIVAAVVVASVGGALVVRYLSPDFSADERAEIRRALDRIPPGVPVAAAPELLPHLSRRVHVYTFPEPFVQLDWGSPLTSQGMAERAGMVRFVALAGGSRPLEYQGDVADVRDMLLDEGWVVAVQAGPVQILERP